MNGFMVHSTGFRSGALLALIGSLLLFSTTQAMAVDTEPLNNSESTADSLSQLIPGAAMVNFARLDGAGDDVDFFQTPLGAGEVLFGMVTPTATWPAGFTVPDTIVGIFDDAGARTFNDDDDAGEFSDMRYGRGSLFRFEAPATANYRIGVSGEPDFDFDGAISGLSHTQSGGYLLTAGRVNPNNAGGDFADNDPANQSAARADLISVSRGMARVAVVQLKEGDVDFFRLDLKTGDALSAMTAPTADLSVSFNYPDTLIGLFDASGTNLLVTNDDAGGYSRTFVPDPENEGDYIVSPDLSSDFPGDQFAGYASALRALIPSDGTYYLAVTGYGDSGFSGAHGELGAYALLVGVAAVPEPSSLALLSLAVPTLVCRRRRR